MFPNPLKTQMTIGLSDLKLNCSIGVLPHEKTLLQEIRIYLKVTFDLLSLSEELSSTIDYTLLAQVCETIAFARHYPLLETLAMEMLNAIFSKCPFVYGWIKIEKMAVFPHVRCAFVEYEQRPLSEGEKA